MSPEQQKALEAADINAFHDWEDGEGELCATTSGVWFAALAYERARVAAVETHRLTHALSIRKWRHEQIIFVKKRIKEGFDRIESIKVFEDQYPRPTP